MYRVFIVLLLITFSFCGFALKKTFSVKDELKRPLTSLLDEAVYLHQAFYSQQEDQIRLTSLKMINQIEMLERSPQLLPYHQRSYIDRLLRSLKPHLEAIRTSSAGIRRTNINAVNRTLTYMAHIYGLKKYAVFYCPDDRSVWLQGKKSKKMKPLHLAYQECGALVK